MKKIPLYCTLIFLSVLLIACTTQSVNGPTPTKKPTTIPTDTSKPPSPTPERKSTYLSIPYVPDGDHQQTLAIYLPEAAVAHPDNKYPVVFLAHGYTMSKDGEPIWDVIQFANRQGYVAVAIDYRDDSENGGACPAHNDAACALAWLYANADEYNMDTTRMVGFGNSYGTHLVSNLAMADEPSIFLDNCPYELPETKPFLGVISFGPATFGLSGPGLAFASSYVADLFADLHIFKESSAEILAINQALSQVPPSEWAGYDGFNQQEKRVAQVFPVYWADPSDPPSLVIVGEGDVYWSPKEGEVYVEYLNSLGVEATYLLLPKAGHTTFGRDESAWQTPLGEFLQAMFED